MPVFFAGSDAGAQDDQANNAKGMHEAMVSHFRLCPRRAAESCSRRKPAAMAPLDSILITQTVRQAQLLLSRPRYRVVKAQHKKAPWEKKMRKKSLNAKGSLSAR